MRRDRIYRIEYEQKWPREKWTGEKHVLGVLANGSVERAISAAKRDALSETYENDNGKTIHCSGFRLLSVAVLATADIEG